MKYQMKAKPKKMMVECLSCGADVYVGRSLKLGEIVKCHSCDSKFEVVDMEPILIDCLIIIRNISTISTKTMMTG